MELAADDLVYLAKLLKDRAKAGSKQSKAATDTLISDADVFIKVAELYKSEFETYRTDPARYRKLVEGLSRFRSLFAQRREVSGLDREVTRVLTHVDQLVSGIERRLEPMIRAGELEQVDEGR